MSHVRRPIRVGLVGLGAHARESLVPAILAIDYVSIVAAYDPFVVDNSPAYSWIRRASTLEDLLSNWAIDAVVVAATPQVNVAVIQACMNLNLPVFLEKPIATSLLAARTVKESAEEGLLIGVGHNFSFAPAMHQAQVWLNQAGMHGVAAGSLNFLASKPRGDRWDLNDSRRSFLLSHATHAFDVAGLFLGSLSLDSFELQDQGNGRFSLSVRAGGMNGGFFNLLVTNAAPRFSINLHMITRSGARIVVDSLKEAQIEYQSPGERAIVQWAPSTLYSEADVGGYRSELHTFFSAMFDSKSKTLTTAVTSRALNGLELIDKILGEY